MGVLDRVFSGLQATGTPEPTSDFWYNPAGGILTPSGQRVDTESARKISAWYRGREILATTLAMLPLQVFERLPNDEGADVARQHPLYDVLHDRPNDWQDAFTWRKQMQYCLIDHGNAYNWIRGGSRGFADELWPIDPTLVTPEQVASGRVVYHVRDSKISQTRTVTQDDIFHLRYGADDGVTGRGILKYARESLGIAQATEGYAGRLFSQGSLHGGVLTVPGVLTDEASKRMAASWVTSQSNWHMPKVAEQGATYTEAKMTPEDAQMLLSRQHSIDDIARWTGVPRMLLENSDPSFGNADQFWLNFLKMTMGGWLSLWEFACNNQLILNRARFYIEFNRDAIERADLATRSESNERNVNAGIETVNEVRRRENRKRIPGEADTLRIPQNITGKPLPEGRQRALPPQAEEPDAKKARAIVVESAARVLRKEMAAVSKLAVKHAANGDAFAVAVTEFYAAHAPFVAATLLMAESAATEYCAGQAAQVLDVGVKAMASWGEATYAAGLAAWALESEAA